MPQDLDRGPHALCALLLFILSQPFEMRSGRKRVDYDGKGESGMLMRQRGRCLQRLPHRYVQIPELPRGIEHVVQSNHFMPQEMA